MQILDFSTSNAQISDEIINVSDSNPVNLGHGAFYNKTGKKVVISTASGGGGTVLTETTDWTSGGAYADGDLPASIAPDVAYSSIAIVNATYHNTDLYVSYYPLGDNINADLWNNQNIPPFYGAGPYDISATDVTLDLTIFNSLPAGAVRIVAAYDGDGSNTLSFTDNGETINNVTIADWVIEGTGELWLMKKSDGNFWAVNPGEVWDSDGGNFSGTFEKRLSGVLYITTSESKNNGTATIQTFNLPITAASMEQADVKQDDAAYGSAVVFGANATTFLSTYGVGVVYYNNPALQTVTRHFTGNFTGRWTTSYPRKTA